MKNSKMKIRMFCFSICIALFTASFFSDVGAVTVSSAAEEVDQLIEMVHGSDDCCWSRVNRKNTMIQKLNAVQDLIEDGNYADAYNKMLHDIKPKLTGLKTDESEEPWANHQYGGCMFHLAWVECEQLREEFWLKCNTILSLLKECPIPVDDTSPPVITISYFGLAHVGEPGYWSVNIEDLESGLSGVQIFVDGVIFLHDTGLAGIESMSYQVPVPGVEGIHAIEVYAVNYDVDGPMEQETSYLISLRDIAPWIDPGDPPVIIIG